MKVSFKTLLAGTLAAGISTGLATTASAQTPPVKDTVKVEKPITIKLGGYFLTDSKAKDAVGSPAFSYGASYDFGKTKSEAPIIYGLYVDGFNKSRTSGGLKGELSDIIAGVDGRYNFTPATEVVRFYGGAGIGISFLHGKKETNVSNGESGTTKVEDSENKTTFGGKLFAGAEYGPGILAEISYNFPGKVAGLNASGFGLQVGYRF